MAAEKEYLPSFRQTTREFPQRVMVIGDPGVGKSSLILAHVEGHKDNPLPDPSLNNNWGVKEKTIATRGAKGHIYLVKQEICDTKGVMGYEARLDGKRIHGMVVAFDITDSNSFENARRWFDKVESYLEEKKVPAVLEKKKKVPVEKKKSIPAVLVGTKGDKINNRQVSIKEAKDLAAEKDVPYVECSAELNADVDRVFKVLAEKILFSHGIHIGTDIPGINVLPRKEELKGILKKDLLPQAKTEGITGGDLRLIKERARTKTRKISREEVKDKITEVDDIRAGHKLRKITGRYEALKKGRGTDDTYEKIKHSTEEFMENCFDMGWEMRTQFTLTLGEIYEQVEKGSGREYFNIACAIVESAAEKIDIKNEPLYIRAQEWLDRIGITSSVSVDSQLALPSGSSSNPYGYGDIRQRSQSSAPPPLPPRSSTNLTEVGVVPQHQQSQRAAPPPLSPHLSLNSDDGVDVAPQGQRSQSSAPPPLPPRSSTNLTEVGVVPQHQQSQRAAPPPLPSRSPSSPAGVGVAPQPQQPQRAAPPPLPPRSSPNLTGVGMAPQHQQSQSAASAPSLPPRPFASRIAARFPAYDKEAFKVEVRKNPLSTILYCPLLNDVTLDPVTIFGGIIYDRGKIEELLQKGDGRAPHPATHALFTASDVEAFHEGVKVLKEIEATFLSKQRQSAVHNR